jgi:hypothetical protein
VPSSVVVRVGRSSAPAGACLLPWVHRRWWRAGGRAGGGVIVDGGRVPVGWW